MLFPAAIWRFGLDMWHVVNQLCSVEENAMIRARVRDAEALLTQVPLTFPLYTRHDHVHAENVLKIMEELLGEDGLARLTGLEAALLVLSAYFHDVGMVATQKEIAGIPTDPDFQSFLNTHPKQAVAGLLPDGTPDTDLVESFLRWRHADRVQLRISEFEEGSFDWGRVPLDQVLVQLSRSHNSEPASLFSLPTDFLGRADVRMCAVLLRLADILDFDHSRSPEILYDHLGLSAGSTSRERVSDGEWNKHLDSNGFQWPMSARVDGYSLYFAAGPQRPAVEHDLRAFLDVIDSEMVGCRRVLRTCDGRWRELALPGPIDRSGIQSRGYRYGDFRFTLDRDALLQLFMGDRLYDNDTVFVRELLQNAIDATRLRQLEEGRGADDSELKLSIDLWVNKQGEQWVSFSDNGTGMGESAIKKYLLTVGASYYNSPEFKARSAKFARDGRGQIVPISRFGIGLLSCFMIGDRVEISTLQAGRSQQADEPVRLSMGELDGYFVLQSGTMPASPMPGRGGEKPGFRRTSGTTVAVRLKPSADIDLSQLESYLRSLLFDIPIVVEINGATFRDVAGVFMKHGASEVVEPLLSGVRTSKRTFLEGVDLSERHLSVFSLNLTEASTNPNLKGQIVIFQVDAAARSVELNDTVGLFAQGYELGRSSLALLESVFRKKTSLEISLEKGLLSYDFSVERSSRAFGLGRVLEEINDGSNGWAASTTHLDPDARVSLQDLAEVVNFESDPGASRSRKKDAVPVSLTEEGKRLLECIKESGLSNDYNRRTAIRFPYANLSWKLSTLGQQDLSTIATTSLSWCGHNGIALPMASMKSSFKFEGKWEDPKRTWLFLGYVSLSDQLRPEVNVARSQVLSFDFQTLAALRLAIRRACSKKFDKVTARRAMSELRDYPLKSENGKADEPRAMHRWPGFPTYREALEAVHASAGGWREESLFYDRARFVPVAQIADLVGVAHFDVTASFEHNRLAPDIEEPIAWALIQEHFDTVERDGRIYATVPRSVSLPRVFSEFPPLTFSRHLGDDRFFAPGSFSLNLSHPLGAWVAEHGQRLMEIDAVIFDRLRVALVRVSRGPRNDVEIMDELDTVLAQVQAKIPGIPAPPDFAWPTEAEFRAWDQARWGTPD